MARFIPILLVLGIFATGASLHAAETAPASNSTPSTTRLHGVVQSFFAEHCLRCHGPSETKGDLRLDQLGDDLSQSRTFERWREILDRIESGEMPPAEEPRPKPERAAAVAKMIATRLDAAAVTERAEGRVVLRRLNRVEYENTVRDLFDVDVAVKEILPEDTISHGFDNVAAALNMSSVQIERYLEAADAVLDAAVAPVHKLESTKERYDLYDSLPKWFVAGVWKQDDGVILFRNSNQSATGLNKWRAPAAGRYRFRVSASGHNAPTPVAMAVLLGEFNVSGNPIQHHGYFDVPAGEPTIFEFEKRVLLRSNTFKVAPVSLPFVYINHKSMPEYPGPGLKIHWIEVEGPLPEAWPTESYRRVFGDVDPQRGTLADAEKLIRKFLPKAFRRPVTSGEEASFTAIVAESLESGQPFAAALRAGYKGVLTSPKFLYFRETPGRLDDHALASRLSYFLWSTMPDDTLNELARSGELRKPEVLNAQVERMLRDPKAKAFTENFTGQWLGLRNIAATSPDKTLYPEFDELLQWSAVRETELFFDELLTHDLCVRNFIDSDFAMLNGRLAKHYGIPDVHGVAMRKVALKPEYHRGGVLTHASVLKVTANGTSTSPVVRGAWVLDRILGRPAPPPPPNVPAVEPDIRGATTVREQLSKHRASATCASCHARIDPPGFALESYDVIGGRRDRYRVVAERKDWVNNRTGPLGKYLAAYQYGLGKTVEAGDVLSDGRRFTDLAEYKKLLLADPQPVYRAITEKLITYATGQPVGFSDHAAVNKILADARSSDYGLRSLIHGIVSGELFQNK
jgi:mono/diheme cytochrome c family protein